MKNLFKTLASVAVLSLAAGQAVASDYARSTTYEVTITNVTKGISFTPFLAATHHNTAPLFSVGEPASAALVRVAEGGDTTALHDELSASDNVHSLAGSEGLLEPGHSVTLHLDSDRHHDRLSLVSMLLPTNDGMVALRSVKLPRKYKQTYLAHAYDAGSEMNDEMCVSIPGPRCGGEPFSPEDHGEGYIYPHPGMHGEGELSLKAYQWQGPVAKVVIRPMR